MILHLDMDSFFASVEQAANPLLRGQPVVVGGGIEKSSVVAAASYEAKAFGIKNGMPTWEAKKLCPRLIVVRGDLKKYISASKIVFNLLYEYTDLVEVFSIDEAFMDLAGIKLSYDSLVQEIKRRIKNQLGLTCSVGIGPNKLMAKLAGELKKPDGFFIIRPEEIPGKIKDLPVSKLCGVGRKTEIQLAQLGIKTFGDLNQTQKEKLVKRFGAACGFKLYEMGQGKGSVVVSPYHLEPEAKSMGHSYTLLCCTQNLDEVKGYLLRLSEQVGRRLRRDNYKGNIVHISLGFSGFQFWGRQRKLEDYINDGYQIFKIAEKLMEPNLKPIRFVGITLSGLIRNLDQLSLFAESANEKSLRRALDEINDRFGEFTIERAAMLKTVLAQKTGMVSPKSYNVW